MERPGDWRPSFTAVAFSAVCTMRIHLQIREAPSMAPRLRSEQKQMYNDQSLRDHLLNLLDSNQAHINFDDAVKDFPRELRGKRPPGSPHTAWQLLEHLRLAQWDILEFTRDPKHVSPEFPQGYWPASGAPPHDRAGDK